MRKILKVTAIVIVAFAAIIFLVPVLFKGKIINIVKGEINANIEAKVDFKDVSLSWFRHFPKLTLALKDISIANVGVFEGDTLLKAKSFDASVDIMSVIRGKDMKVYGIYLNSPQILAKINKEGLANWEITKSEAETAEAGTASPFQLNLERYVITNGDIEYIDETSGMRAAVKGLDHSGKGNFTQDVFTLSTKTKTVSANFTYANIPYLVNAETGIDADIEINNASSKYSFSNANLIVNDLKVLASGFFRLVNDSTYDMDIKFDAPGNDFKNILSLIPAIYKNEFSKIKTTGQASLKGFAKGIYSSNSLPAYSVDLIIKDGSFQYPDLPKPVKNIQVAAQFSNVDGVPDHTVIDIQRAHLEFGNDPFDFKLIFKNPMTTQYLDLVVKGKLELAEISKFVKLDAGTQLSGSVHADAFAKGNAKALETQKGPFVAGGFFTIRNFGYASKDLPFPVKKGSFDVQVQNAGGVADATQINVTAGHIEMGDDVFDFDVKLDKPVTAMAFSGNAKGRFSLDKLQKFVEMEPGTSVKGMVNADLGFAGTKTDIDKSDYEKISLKGNVELQKIQYVSKDYPGGVKIEAAKLSFNPSNAVLHSMAGTFQGTNFTASGVLDNMIAYALDKGQLNGSMQFAADRIQLNEWMGTSTTSANTAATTEPFLVPGKMDLALNANVGAVEYDKVTYKNVTGKMLLKDETVHLQNVQTEALGGTMMVNGSYSTKINKQHPDVSLNYSIKEIDIQQAFFAYNTFQKLMPIGQFLSGKMNSQFQMTGKLGADMFPELSSLSGGGDLLLVQGVLSKFKPMDNLANNLQVNALKDISVKDIKTRFEFANGKVLMKPFTIKVRDIDMQIGGTHGLDQSMDYIIGMKIPRSYLGNAGNNLINGLAAEAGKKGVAVNLSEFVDLNVKMLGSMNNPTIKTDLKQTTGDISQDLKQQANSFVQQKVDSTKKAFSDTLSQVKQQLVNDAKTTLVNQLTGNKDSSGNKLSLDSTKKQAEDKIKSTLNNLLKKKKKEGE